MKQMNINIKKPKGVTVHVRIVVSKRSLAELQKTSKQAAAGKP